MPHEHDESETAVDAAKAGEQPASLDPSSEGADLAYLDGLFSSEAGWALAPIIAWIVEEGRRIAEPARFFAQLCGKLMRSGCACMALRPRCGDDASTFRGLAADVDPRRQPRRRETGRPRLSRDRRLYRQPGGKHTRDRSGGSSPTGSSRSQARSPLPVPPCRSRRHRLRRLADRVLNRREEPRVYRHRPRRRLFRTRSRPSSGCLPS